jgi:hypothetical protein
MKSSQDPRDLGHFPARAPRHDGLVNRAAFYVSEGSERYSSGPSTGSPWGPDSQHGGPPAALLARSVERIDTGNDRVVGRFTMELLGPVPVGPVSVTSSVLRPGRSVELCEASLYDGRGGRAVATAAAWRFPVKDDGPRSTEDPLPHTPDDGEEHDRPPSWSSGYLDAVEWRWIKGAVMEPGPGVVWMRPRVDLVEGEQMSQLQRLMTCVDSASGVSAALDPGGWAFLNTELTVHVLRPPVGEWLCLDARTTLADGSVGLATSDVYDERGLVARSAQALLVARR